MPRPQSIPPRGTLLDEKALRAYLEGLRIDFAAIEVEGTDDEITVSNGDFINSSTATVGITDNPNIPGTQKVKIPVGTTAARPGSPEEGYLRYNSTLDYFEGYENGAWVPLNTLASSEGVAGVSIFKDKSGQTLRFKSINAGSNKITVTDDTGNDEIDIDVDETNINHDNTSGFVTNEHIDHSSVDITAGTALSGGGDITTSRTINYSGSLSDQSDANITTPSAGQTLLYNNTAGQFENAGVTAGTGISTTPGDASLTIATDDANIDHDSLQNFVANEHVDHSSVTLTAGEGLTGGGDITTNRSFALDYSDLSTTDTAAGSTDLVSIHDGAQKKITFANFEGSVNHDNTSGFVANEHVDHSGVTLTAGSGLSGGGDITTSRTFNVDISSETSVTAATDDEILIADTSDLGNIKKVTAQSIADLGGGGGGGGTVVQTVVATYTGSTPSTSSSSPSDTGFSASITPTSTSNKIVGHVFFMTTMVHDGSGNASMQSRYLITRGATTIQDCSEYRLDTDSGTAPDLTRVFTPYTMIWQETAPSTSEITYDLEFAANNCTITMSVASSGRPEPTIILQELEV